MPKRSRSDESDSGKPKKASRSRDPNVRAFEVMLEATGEKEKLDPDAIEREKNPAAVALGRLGGKKGGKARAANMTAKQRSEAARKAAKARWRAARRDESNESTPDAA